MRFNTITLLLLICHLVHATDSLTVSNSFYIKASRASEQIKIDGVLNEPIWSSSEKVVLSQEHWPQNGRTPLNKTEALVTRDDQFLYVAFTCHDVDNKYIIQTLKRDFEYDKNDFVSVLIDPNGQKNTGYVFAVSPAGVQAEAIANRFDIDVNWDNKWYSAVKTHTDHWIAEFAIPLFILRYEPALTTWNLNFIRGDVKNFRFYTWVAIPQQYEVIDLGYLGALDWENNLPKNGGKITTIPYLNTSAAKDFEDGSKSDNKLGFGGDAKITLSSNLNLDLTVNPDFSQVEVDRQVTNITRFNVFFPERRNFFLENADLFGQFGDPESPIFFSRRIGLDEEANPVPIIAGARLTGNLGDTWRIGALSMQTKKTAGQAGQNYSAFTLHKKIWKRSLIKGLITNRQAVDNNEFSKKDYGRNASVEFVYQRPDGKILSWLGYHKSFKHQYSDRDQMVSTGVMYNGTNLTSLLGIGTIGTNYTADMGFINQLDNYDAERDTVIRQGFNNLFHFSNYTKRTPNHAFINAHEWVIRANIKQIPNQPLNELTARISYAINFKSSAELSAAISQNLTRLLYPFSFTDEGLPLPAAKYSYSIFNVEYNSDVRKPLGFQVESSMGGFYNGSIRALSIGLNYRKQPWGVFQMNVEYNDLKFPAAYGRAQFLLINPKLEFNFTKSLYWTTFLQYNTQADNFNINSRLQWRYKPMSDLFLVYTDNYAVQFWGPKNRTIVLKLNYWLNL